MTRNLLVIATLVTAGCGVPKEYVRQQTRAAFDNAASVAAHVKLKCGDPAVADDNCKQADDKLAATCTSLDELAKKAGGTGFDCATWKATP